MATAGAVTKKGRRIPSAAHFTIVKADDEIVFGGKFKVSPYLLALQGLIKAGNGNMLQVDSLGARASIYAQSRKHGIKVLFGEKNGKLYVKIDGENSPESMVREFLKTGQKTLGEIGAFLDSRGFADLKITDVTRTLLESGHVRLQDVGNVKKYLLAKQ